MVINLRQLFVLLFLFLLPYSANAVLEEKKKQAVQPPVLEDMATDWWRYIAEAGDQLPSRVDTILTVLGFLPGDAYGEIKAEIRQAFRAYQLSLNKKPTPAVAEPVMKDAELTLDDIVAVNHQLTQLKTDLQFHQDSLIELQGTQTQAEKALAALKLSYLEIPKGDSARTSLALPWIRDRIQLAIIEQAIKNEQRIIKIQTESMTASQVVLDDAMARIRFDNLDTAALKTRLQTLERNVTRLGMDLTESHTALLQIAETTESEKALARLKSQDIIKLQVERNKVEVQAQTIRLKFALSQLGSATEKPDAKNLRQLSSQTEKLIKSSQSKLKRWQSITKSELNASNAQQVATTEPEMTKLSGSRISLAQKTTEIILQLQQEVRDLELLAEIFQQRLLLSLGGTSRALGKATLTAGELWDKSTLMLRTPLFEVNETPITSLGLLRFILIIFVAWLFSRGIRLALSKLAQKKDGTSSSSVSTLSKVLHYLILFVGSLIALSSLGIDVTKLALIATALSIGIGFGLQNLINNFVSGIILMFERSLRVGDFIELQSGVSGEVRELNIRSTVITTNDNIDIVVPNSEFVSGRVTNWTMREAYCRIHIPFGVAYGSDKELVKKAALEAAATTPHTMQTRNLRRQPQVWLVGLGDSSLNFELVVWLSPEAVKRPGSVKSAYTWEIESALKKYGIEIPFPQRDLHIRSGLELLTPTAGIPVSQLGEHPVG